MPALPGFTLYAHGPGSVELLSGNNVRWEDWMGPCNECGRRDGCAGPDACERPEDDDGEVNRDA
jgi:hypothetical protein